MFGFFRIAVVSPDISIADPDANRQIIRDHCKVLAKDQVCVAVFPELSLTSYSCGDLFQNPHLVATAWKSLENLASDLRALPLTVVVGLPVSHLDRLYNCAAVIQNGQICGLVPKSVIPNYREFYEQRWFSSGRNLVATTYSYGGGEIPFGNDLLFSMGQSLVFGIEICEDLWSPEPISVGLAANGAQLILNLSASNAVIGKAEYRRQLVLAQSSRLSCAYAYVSAGPSESTTDLVFSGHCMIAEYGQMLAEVESRDLNGVGVTADIDVVRLKGLRRAEGSYAERDPLAIRVVKLTEAIVPQRLKRTIDADPFVPIDPLTRDLRCQEVFELQILALKRRLRHTGLKTMVLGLSGGLDSTLAALVCARVAADAQYQFRVMAISMPGFGTSDRTRKNAMALAKSLGISCTEIDITSACEHHFRDIGHDGKTADITFENVQARERTQILMDIANKNSGLVIGTSDLSEIALGWSTFGGDHLSMYAVNCSVPKTLLRYVIAWVADKDGSSLRSILVDILATPVSPELIPTHSSSDIVQKTEDIIGPYRVHDFFMYHFLRYGCEPKRLLFLANQAFAGEYSDVQLKAQLKVFLQRFFQNQFKRSCTPDGPKIGTIALSPRGDWRMPSDASAKAWLDQLQ